MGNLAEAVSSGDRLSLTLAFEATCVPALQRLDDV